MIRAMKIIIVSNCAVLREGILAIVGRYSDVSVRFVGETVKDAMFMIKSNMADILLLDINEENQEELQLAEAINTSGLDIKMMVLDFQSRDELFLRALSYGAHGYISGKSNEEEIMYAMNQIYRGKKYFDSSFVDYIINKKRKLSN